MTLERYQAQARASGLTVQGVLRGDGGTGTRLLLGPDEGAFWPLFTAAPEYADGAPDPMDRWSRRVIGALAALWGGSAQLPSDGPPYPPFIAWALASGRAWPSPVGPLVHDAAGLLISYRGAVLLAETLALPAAPVAASPCTGCARPCVTACPVNALSDTGPYDVPACQAYVRANRRCMAGCLVRAACPVSQAVPRPAAQNAFHMAAFLGE
ncbi:MAG: ferredoxin [Roseivivax sp.]|nr:ferredoxin [Roseivivax sp.]